MTLQEAFSQVDVRRRGPARRYDLGATIVMAICAMLCGRDDRGDAADWRGEEEEEDELMPRCVGAGRCRDNRGESAP